MKSGNSRQGQRLKPIGEPRPVLRAMTADKGYRYDDDVEMKLMELMNKLQKKSSDDKQDELLPLPPKLLKPKAYASPYSKTNIMLVPGKKVQPGPKKELDSLPSLYLKLPEQELPKTCSPAQEKQGYASNVGRV